MMIILRQRNYSLGSDLKYSGITRTIKKYIGRGRRNLGNKLYKSIDKDLEKASEASHLYKSLPKVSNPEIEKKLIQDAEKSGKVGVIKFGDESTNLPHSAARTIDNNAFRALANDRRADKLKEIVDSGKDLIVYADNAGIGELAHEIGHANTKNSVLRKISKIEETGESFKNLGNKRVDTTKGFKESAKRFIKSRSVLAEEKLANKEGLRLLKKSGAKKNELDFIKDQYKASEKDYKHTANAYYKIPAANKI